MKTKKKAGEFFARCNLTKPHPVQALPEYLRREYAENGWKRATRHTYDRSLRRDIARECFLEPLCEGFETTDRAAFEDHMRSVHGVRPLTGANSALTNAAAGKWRTPKAKPEGAPLLKAVTERVRTCESCGLHSEIVGTYGDELWWREHVERCVGSAAVSA